MTDREPQPELLSTNTCPNSGPDHLRIHAPQCAPYGATVYGYCAGCWDAGRVPPAWATLVDRLMVEVEAARRGMPVADVWAECAARDGAAS